MGCSASRSHDFVSRDLQNPSNFSSSNSNSNSRSQSPYSCSDSCSTPVSRTLSLPTPLVHHPAMCKGDTNHLVSLTSTTYGSLVLIDTQVSKPNINPNFLARNFMNPASQTITSLNGSDLRDPSSPDSVINTWELMEGLDDFDFHNVQSQIEHPRKPKSKILGAEKVLDINVNELEKSYEFVEHSDSKPLWKHLSEESLLANMDPNVASSYRKALSSKRFGCKESEDFDLPPKIDRSIESSNTGSLSSLFPNSGFHLKGTEDKIVPESEDLDLPPKIDRSIESSNTSSLSSLLPKSGFHLNGTDDRIVLESEDFDLPPKIYRSIESSNTSSLSSLLPYSGFHLKGTEDRIVLYYTSLRGIRKTYEDCCNVRMIFRGFPVSVDERDISMDSSYRKELQGVLEGKAVSLPQVFIRGSYIGGAEQIKQLNEAGKLAKLLDGFPINHTCFICESCGDARFVPCPNCNGGRKVFEEEEGKLRRCPNCNENGLIRCPGCCP